MTKKRVIIGLFLSFFVWSIIINGIIVIAAAKSNLNTVYSVSKVVSEEALVNAYDNTLASPRINNNAPAIIDKDFNRTNVKE